MPRTSLFLERKSYRMRRIMDAIRFMPFVCAALWMVVPLMWSGGQGAHAATPLSAALWYIFGIWALAVMVSFALWWRIRSGDVDAAVSAADTSA